MPRHPERRALSPADRRSLPSDAEFAREHRAGDDIRQSMRRQTTAAIRKNADARHRGREARHRGALEQRSGGRPDQSAKNAQARHVRPREYRALASTDASTSTPAKRARKVTQTRVLRDGSALGEPFRTDD